MQNDGDSPNLDFLKLGSPDLEQMFMNIEDENDFPESIVHAANDTRTPITNPTTAAFNLDEDLLETTNCFTDTLQHLHDKQIQNSIDSLNLLDIPVKLEKEEEKNCQKRQEFDLLHQRSQHINNELNQPRYRQRKQSSVKLNPQKNNSNSNDNKTNWKYVGGYGKKGRENAPPLIHHANLQNNHQRSLIQQQHRSHQQISQNCTEPISSLSDQIPPLLNIQQSQQQNNNNNNNNNNSNHKITSWHF